MHLILADLDPALVSAVTDIADFWQTIFLLMFSVAVVGVGLVFFLKSRGRF